MTPLRIVGLIILLLGFSMLGWGVTAFSWRGPGLSDFMNEVGKYSFFLWLPTIIVGIALIAIGGRRKQNN